MVLTILMLRGSSESTDGQHRTFFSQHRCQRLGFSRGQHGRDRWQDARLLGHGSWIMVAARKTLEKNSGAVGSPVAQGLSTRKR